MGLSTSDFDKWQGNSTESWGKLHQYYDDNVAHKFSGNQEGESSHDNDPYSVRSRESGHPQEYDSYPDWFNELTPNELEHLSRTYVPAGMQWSEISKRGWKNLQESMEGSVTSNGRARA
jgi:hypothetical protein